MQKYKQPKLVLLDISLFFTPHIHTVMAKNCCRYFTVSLVPVAALVLAIVFACGTLVLPILYTELVKHYVVRGGA